MSAIVIPIAQEPAAVKMLRETMEQMQEGEISDFVIIKRKKNGKSVFTWYAQDSSYRVLGMIQYMVYRVQRYIDREFVIQNR